MSDLEYPEFFDEREHKSKKAHQCFECRDTIPAETRYSKVAGKWGGDFASFKFCLRCKRLHQFMRTVGIEAGYGQADEALDYYGLLNMVRIKQRRQVR